MTEFKTLTELMDLDAFFDASDEVEATLQDSKWRIAADFPWDTTGNSYLVIIERATGDPTCKEYWYGTSQQDNGIDIIEFHNILNQTR